MRNLISSSHCCFPISESEFIGIDKYLIRIVAFLCRLYFSFKYQQCSWSVWSKIPSFNKSNSKSLIFSRNIYCNWMKFTVTESKERCEYDSYYLYLATKRGYTSKIKSHSARASKRYLNDKSPIYGQGTASIFRFSAEILNRTWILIVKSEKSRRNRILEKKVITAQWCPITVSTSR